MIISGNGYIEARELDPFLQELFEARYHVSICVYFSSDRGLRGVCVI